MSHPAITEPISSMDHSFAPTVFTPTINQLRSMITMLIAALPSGHNRRASGHRKDQCQRCKCVGLAECYIEVDGIATNHTKGMVRDLIHVIDRLIEVVETCDNLSDAGFAALGKAFLARRRAYAMLADAEHNPLVGQTISAVEPHSCYEEWQLGWPLPEGETPAVIVVNRNIRILPVQDSTATSYGAFRCTTYDLNRSPRFQHTAMVFPRNGFDVEFRATL